MATSSPPKANHVVVTQNGVKITVPDSISKDVTPTVTHYSHNARHPGAPFASDIFLSSIPVEGFPTITAGMYYAPSDETIHKLGRHSSTDPNAPRPEYVGWRTRYGSFASNCPSAPRMSDVTETIRVKCKYRGDKLALPDGTEFSYPKPVVTGMLPSCQYNGFATDPISDHTLRDVRMLASDKVDPTGVAQLEVNMWECSLSSF